MPATPEAAGKKVSGLLGLPPDWYPPTVVLQVGGSSQHDGEDSAGRESTISDRDFAAIQVALQTPRAEGLIARSSAAHEDINSRGQFESFRCDSSAYELRKAIRSVLDFNRTVVADATPMAVAIQPYLGVVQKGHLSNEHRLARNATSWLLEVDGVSEENVTIAATDNHLVDDGPLVCHDSGSVRRVLSGVAWTLSGRRHRHHLEWVWDGARVWIVQCDPVPPVLGASPGEAWMPTRGRSVERRQLHVWRWVDPTEGAWNRFPKLECRSQFAAASLPVVDVFALAGGENIRQLLDGPSGAQVADLRILCSGHFIVRTDIDSGDAGTELMLPKSRASTDPEEILKFMVSTATQLLEDGIDASNIAFIGHRFLRSRGCAWTFARPGSEVVKIDSLWGLNDGLSWLPHDSSQVSVRDNKISRSTSGKPSFLDISSENEWAYRETPTEWIWRSTVSDEQLRAMAAGAHALARELDRPVITMWFLGLLDGGDADMLPWFQAPWDAGDEGGVDGPESHAIRHVVSSEADLDGLPDGALAGHVLALVPNEDLIRNRAFVDRVVTIALARSLFVEIEGSPLAHPFYMLRKAGVPVYTKAAEPARPGDITFNKLVRDKIPGRIADHGEHAKYARVDDFGIAGLLRQKIVEEALELLAATNDAELVAEIADVLEAIEGLIEVSAWTAQDVDEAKLAKRRERGGFESQYVLLSTSETSDPNELVPELQGTLPGLGSPAPTTSRFRRTRNALEVSLVPPAPGEPRTVRSRLGDREFTVTFTESTLVIRTASAPPESPDSVIQPDLWT